ncbi:acyl-CoA desaturase [Paracrocinitomix mangrovi]|uniref:fatty acid desaturase family protein n=1 Tax=Paracrocinitomix mangrovi TaxID=2862509 RepID=UPI001C8E3D64|nr:acyl-CoA desaturase [Paracrocinitomix mangrovi]UKN02324.1 acyl-CoA desaturase [Paracrocinitomix mangrovi]
MQTIKFKAKDTVQKEFAKELSKRVRKYFKEHKISTYGGSTILIKAIVMLALYLAPIVVIFTVSMPAWSVILLLVLMGIGKAGVGMGVMHDAAHGSFSKHEWLNNLMANSMMLFGSNVLNWKIQHNLLHHTYPNVYEWDSDVDTKGLIRLSKNSDYKKKFRYQHVFGPFLYSFMTLSRFSLEFKWLKAYNKLGALKVYNAKYSSALWKLILIKVVYLFVMLVLPVLLTDFTWWQVLIGFMIINVVSSIIMGTVFQMAHVVEDMNEPMPDENFEINDDFYVHQLKTTSDFGIKKTFLSAYIGGLDFQVEHHLFPHISHIHYPKLSHIVQETAKEYGQPYHSQKSFYAAFKSHIRTLKRLGQD